MVSYYGKMQPVSLDSVFPRGWLLRYLELQKDGLTGHLEKAGYPFDSVSWAMGDAASACGTSNPGWWAYEQTAYWLDGMERTAQLLQDEELLSRAQEVIDAVLSHPDEDGYLGPLFLKETDGWCRWPHVVFFRALMAYYSVTKDPAVVQAVTKHYLSGTCEFYRFRDVMNVEIMLWAYSQNGDKRLLELAENTYRVYNETATDDNTVAVHRSRYKPYVHGVTFNEFTKLGAILYLHTGKKEYLAPTINAYKKLDRQHMLVSGLHCSNEFLLDNHYMRSHETCDVSDYTWALSYLLMATGDGAYADKLERCVFNAGFGSVDETFRALQYFSCPNQLVLDRHSNHNDFFKGEAWMSYRPNPGTECCPANVNRFFPNYCAHMWMQSEGGVAAVLYGDSVLTQKIGETDVSITQSTAYPFEDTVRFAFSASDPFDWEFSLRIPAWCQSPRVTFNGLEQNNTVENGFIKIASTFHDGDRIELHLPSIPRVCSYHGQGIYVEKGPLVYAFGMYGDRRIDKEDTRSTDDFPAYNIYPDREWNYALKEDETRVEVIEHAPMSDEPWHIDRVPLAIRIPARKLHGWRLLHRRRISCVENLYDRPWKRLPRTGDYWFTPPHPTKRFVREHGMGDEEWITLVPMGCAKLRLTVFPMAPEERE